MKTHLLFLSASLALAAGAAPALAQGTAFTYQGRLTDGASPANGSYDFRFELYADAAGASQVGSALTNSAALLANGLFTATLDFGPGSLPGADRWLAIAVRATGGGAFTALTPLQKLTPAPYAVMAASAANLTGPLPRADSIGYPFSSAAANEFAVRATGGVRFVSGVDASGNPRAGVSLAAGGGSWSSLSDRDSKANVAAVDARQVLERLAQLPIATWNYKSQAPAVRHIGPMAQDFFTAFGVGEDQRHITGIDADGVALAAVQGLNRKLEASLAEKEAQILELRQALAQLKQQLERLSK